MFLVSFKQLAPSPCVGNISRYFAVPKPLQLLAGSTLQLWPWYSLQYTQHIHAHMKIDMCSIYYIINMHAAMFDMIIHIINCHVQESILYVPKNKLIIF